MHSKKLMLVNYSHADCTPLKNIMRLPEQEAFRLARTLAAAHPGESSFWRFSDFENYYALRKRQDAFLYAAFLAKGGKPEVEHPLSFVVEGNDYLREWFGNGVESRLMLEKVDSRHISFTVGDSGWAIDNHLPVEVLTKEEFLEQLEDCGGDLHILLGKAGKKYVEVQLWSDEYLKDME